MLIVAGPIAISLFSMVIILSTTMPLQAFAQGSSESTGAGVSSDTTVVIPKGAGVATAVDAASDTEFYIPKSITIKQGGTITWVNQDSTPHTVTNGEASSDLAGNLFGSSIIGIGQQFQHKFEATGTFPYFCDIHPYMIGTVKVISESEAEAGTSVSSGGEGNDNTVTDENGITVEGETHAKPAVLYKNNYQMIAADSKNSFTVQSQQHLYTPGDKVTIEGSVWSNLIAEIGGNSDTVSIEVKDSNGNVIFSKDNADVNANGVYSTSFELADSTPQGAYTIDSKINVEANILDAALQADVSAKLATSSKFVVVSPMAFPVTAEGMDFNVQIASNSTVNDFKFNQQEKKISFTVEGKTGTRGVTQVTIPKPMLSGGMTVMIDGKAVTEESNDVILIADTDSKTTLEMNYGHSKHNVEVIGTNVVPEFPLSMLVMAIATGSIVSMAAIAKRKSIGPFA